MVGWLLVESRGGGESRFRRVGIDMGRRWWLICMCIYLPTNKQVVIHTLTSETTTTTNECVARAHRSARLKRKVVELRFVVVLTTWITGLCCVF